MSEITPLHGRAVMMYWLKPLLSEGRLWPFVNSFHFNNRQVMDIIYVPNHN